MIVLQDHRHIAQDDNLEGEEEKAVEVAEAGGVEMGRVKQGRIHRWKKTLWSRCSKETTSLKEVRLWIFP